MNGGRWPTSPPVETGRFAACPADRFRYEPTPDGGMTLRYDERGRTATGHPTRFRPGGLPTHFTVH